MKISERRIALLPIFALLLYLAPNLIQNVHRVIGHPEPQVRCDLRSGIQVLNHKEKCPVCVFEFIVIDHIENAIYIPSPKIESFLFCSKQEDQLQKITFHYYNLRGPPIA